MPGLNGTGPRGMGPMTGGGFGFCTGFLPTPYSRYSPRQPTPFNQNPYPSNMQNPYIQNYGLNNVRFQAPNQYNPQAYYGGLPAGLGMGRGLGLGLGWRRGLGPGIGYGRGMGLGRRRGFF